MKAEGAGTRHVFTALHRKEADLEANQGIQLDAGTEIALDQWVAHVASMK
jgi:hypothetical protein